ncbi:MAG: hypothetical protein ACREIW_06880 [Chthoniobacterales bacterium]
MKSCDFGVSTNFKNFRD